MSKTFIECLILFIFYIKTAYCLDITCAVVNCNYSDQTKITSSNTSASGIFLDTAPQGVLNYDITNDTVTSKTRHYYLTDMNISQTSSDSNSPSVHTIISDLVDTLNLTASGYNGSNGVNSSSICAGQFLNGTYGNAAKTNFTSRHGNNGVCDDTDVQYLTNNNFLCPNGYSISNSPNILVSQNNQERYCSASLTNNICVRKSYDLTCTDYANGPLCCNNLNGSLTFSNLSSNTFPVSFFSNLCDPTQCGNNQNGIYFNRNVRVYGESNKNVSNCGVKSPTLTLKFNDGTMVDNSSSNVTAYSNSTTRPAIDLSANLTILNSSNIVDNLSNYRLMITNVPSLNSSGISVKNCFGLNGSAENNYICAIKPGDSVTIKVAAIDSNGNYSNEVSFVVSPNQKVAMWTASSCSFYSESDNYIGIPSNWQPPSYYDSLFNDHTYRNYNNNQIISSNPLPLTCTPITLEGGSTSPFPTVPTIIAPFNGSNLNPNFLEIYDGSDIPFSNNLLIVTFQQAFWATNPVQGTTFYYTNNW